MRVLGIGFRTQKAWKAYLPNLDLDTVQIQNVGLLLILHKILLIRRQAHHHKQEIMNFSDYFMPKNGIICQVG